MRQNTHRLLGTMACALSLAACHSKRQAAPASLDDSYQGVGGPTGRGARCETGAQQACSVTLSQHNGVLNCFKGTQHCVEGVWSECANGTLVSRPAPGQTLSTGLRLKAITGALECETNPCDPSCMELERPADAGANTSELIDEGGSFDWETGRLADFPGGLVNKGLTEPCSTGSDCQFNTRCDYPVSGSCAHSKCAEGVALDSSCDTCVSEICAVDPRCCEAAASDPPVCDHDPCAEGAALEATCNSCVSAVCAADPSCCSGSWGPSCVAAVTSVCGATCSCTTGEVASGGKCFYREEADYDWVDARESCQKRGAGWDLASVADAIENTFIVSNILDDSETWIGFTDDSSLSTDNEWLWSSGNPSGIWDQTAGGGSTVLVPLGSSWKYNATNVSPGPFWAQSWFNDFSWPDANASLGFGSGGSAPATSFPKNGPSYYFRHFFNVPDPPSGGSLTVRFDDGYVAYLNGAEIAREDVGGTFHWDYATGSTGNYAEETTVLNPASLAIGSNLLAIVVKNRSSSSNDLYFDAQLSVQATSGAGIYENFGAGEPGTDACALFDAYRVGTWSGEGCNRRRDSLCSGPPQEMTNNPLIPVSGPWEAITTGASWKYLANNVNPGSSWAEPSFDDSSWSTGTSQLGFGNGDEATTIANTGPSYYFRHVVNIPTEISDASIDITFDDAFALYINGKSVDSRNMAYANHSWYAGLYSSNNETVTLTLDADDFVVGNNTIAVYLKNGSAYSSDVSFDAELNVNLCGPDGCPADPAWTSTCVDLVGSVCDARCDTADPPAATGQCTAWNPGETDSTCAGVDLALGVPCDGSIPVCNHGNATAPAGVKIIHYPANSGHYPSCDPDQSHAQLYECYTDEEIPPGECINVTSCPQLIGNREMMVNPQGDDYVAECSCQDNWSLYSNGSCGEPICDGGTSVATLSSKPVDIIFVIDNSGSMMEEIAQVQQRINEDFAAIIEASGVDYRVIMVSRYGDINIPISFSSWYPICISSPLGGHDCSSPSYQPVTNNPGRFYHYSADIFSTDALCRLLEGFHSPDEIASDYRSWTPVAPNGYSEFLREEAFKAFVVITDDNIDCTYGGYAFKDYDTAALGTIAAASFDTALLTLSPAHFGTAADRNYVFHSIVAMGENSPGTEPWPSTAAIQTSQCSPGSEAPGTGYQALSVLTGGLRYPTCRHDDFDAIFQALAEDVVEGAVASCSIELDGSEEADPDSTTVTYSPGDGSDPIELNRASNLASCSSRAYYYEDDATITLCPTTCAEVQADLSGTLAVEVGCVAVPTYDRRVLTERYQSECDSETTVQWSFLTYQSSTPGDSSIEFRVRTADTEAGLASAAWVTVATAQADPDTQNCTLAGPSPCAIDLYPILEPLGGAHHEFAELEVSLNPTSDLSEPATIQRWELTYSCPYSQ